MYQSKYGAIERQVPPLVDTVLWEQAKAQLKRNQRLPKGNATRTYLLRGLLTCGQCGGAYVGQTMTYRSGTQGMYYRCGGRSPSHYPMRPGRCPSRAVNAMWLEQTVWEDCRTFIGNPGEALEEAQRQLQARMATVAQRDQERGRYVQALAGKAQERDRIMTLFRRGRIALQDAEAQLDDIAREESDVRQHLTAIDAQKALAEAYESHMTDASLLLHRLQDRLVEIDQTHDVATKRQVIELLVHGIHIDIQQTGTRKRATATITYAFSPIRVADFSTRRHGSTPRKA